MFNNQCNLCSYKVTQVADFLGNTEVQETECLTTSVLCVPPCIYNKDTLVAKNGKEHAQII
jgi:hypothetical protein